MKQIKSLNLLENKKVLFWLNIIGGGLLFLFFPLFSIIASETTKESFHSLDLKQLFQVFILAFFLIIAHEAIHGLFFKVMNPKSQVKFGFKKGMAYATSPGTIYNKWQFIWISLAPFVVITFSLWLALFFNLLNPAAFVYLATFHASACVGDFYWVYLVLGSPKNAWIEDTEVGINFYTKED